MKIKLAILENDENYLNRIVTVFNSRYSDKIEVYSFTSDATAIPMLEKAKIDVLLADDAFEINTKELPKRCGFAYLVNSNDIESLRDEKVIGKFQKAELIYKQVLSIFAENVTEITGIRLNENGNCKLIAFLSPSGGTGSSTAAAACAMRFAKQGRKTLYLNLERLGNADLFFHAEGQDNFGDVIYALKSKKTNLTMKLESAVKQDENGVYFYSATNLALDMAELCSEEIRKLLSTFQMFGGYEYIILDMDFALDKSTIEVLRECNSIVLVADGSAVSNNKLERALASLNILEQQTEMKLLMRSSILYNRFSSHTSAKPNLADIKELGGIKRYEGYSTAQLLTQLSEMTLFDALA